MAPPKSKRVSRKRRKAGAAPASVPSARRKIRAERQVPSEREERRHDSMLGAHGEPPPGPFGGLPVSEFAIFVGAIGVVVGLSSAAPAALAVGIVVCTLGVAEVTGREHFSGYRSHAALLAAIPAVGIGVAMIGLVGGSLSRGPLLVVVVLVFGILFSLLRKRFRTARQARIARPPAP